MIFERRKLGLMTAARGAAGALLLSACDGPQSTLDPAGREAARIADLFWWMTGGAAVIWLAVVALYLYATHAAPREHGRKTSSRLIVYGGVVFPTVLLAGLLTYGLAMLPDFLAPAPEGSLRIRVVGEQWWWRVRYLPEGGEPVDLANEIHLPVGEPVTFELESADVIHALWIPSLGGKIDMIPGRQTRLTLHPEKTGLFRGVCAEYCGASHAFMAFPVVVEERAAFDAWLARQAKPAAPPEGKLPARGREVFFASGCGACHAVRGTPAEGVLAPDLTHVGSRLTIGAGLLPSEPGELRSWTAHPQKIKPGVLMPAFGMIPKDDLEALAAYLEGLE